MLFFQYRSYMLEIKVSSWQYDAMCRQHSSNLFFPPATFEKKKKIEKKEKQKQKLYVMDVLSESNA